MHEERICNLEVELILQNQYKYDHIKSFLKRLISCKQQNTNNYSDLQLLADVSFYYQKINNTINITTDVLETTSKILELNALNNGEIDNFLDLTWNQIKEETIQNIINNIEEINNLPNNYLVNSSYPSQKFLR